MLTTVSARVLTFMCCLNHQWSIYTQILKSADKDKCELYSLHRTGVNRDCHSRRRNHPFENEGPGSFSRPDRLPGEPFEAPHARNIALHGSVRSTGECRDVPAIAWARNYGDGISATHGADGCRAGRFFTRRDGGSLGRAPRIARQNQPARSGRGECAGATNV